MSELIFELLLRLLKVAAAALIGLLIYTVATSLDPAAAGATLARRLVCRWGGGRSAPRIQPSLGPLDSHSPNRTGSVTARKATALRPHDSRTTPAREAFDRMGGTCDAPPPRNCRERSSPNGPDYGSARCAHRYHGLRGDRVGESRRHLNS